MLTKRAFLVPLLVLLIAPGLPLAAMEPHQDYRGMTIKECSECHNGEGVAPTHLALWNREHRIPAQKNPNNCDDCHDQSFCQDCHFGAGIDPNLHISQFRGNYKPRDHRSNFVEIHPIRSMDNPTTCTRCHEAKFCSNCHARFRPEDLRILSHRKGFSNIEVSRVGPRHSQFSSSQCRICHPGGILPKHVWSREHRQEALRSLQSCQTCHVDGQLCLKCHSARQGLAINPHPRNWSAIKENIRGASGGEVCRKCHVTVP